MTELTTTIRVRITVHENDPRDPKDWAKVIEDHLWETFNDAGGLVSVEHIPEPPQPRSFTEELQRGMAAAQHEMDHEREIGEIERDHAAEVAQREAERDQEREAAEREQAQAEARLDPYR